jgi:very-short-patch-repair endonuclease/uncharacterized Zn-finger protein
MKKGFLKDNNDLMKQWHFEKNVDLPLDKLTLGSSLKAWWKCENGHEWPAAINVRDRGNGCPYCSNKKVGRDNNLLKINPNLAAQWHPTKNGKLSPAMVTTMSSKKVWWQCEKGHEWPAVISSRSSGRGCPECSKETRSSFPEQALFYYIKQAYPSAINSYKLKILGKRYEIDIFIPEYSIGIEYDGERYHNTNKSKERDEIKNRILFENGTKLIRIREDASIPINLSKCSVINIKYNTQYSNLNYAIRSCLNMLDEISGTTSDVIIDIANDAINIQSQYVARSKANSILEKFPEIAAQWHPTKNGKIRPNYVNIGSIRKYWWLCEKKHEWQAVVKDRVSGTNCPYCSGRKVCPDNNLEVMNPLLAAQWHPTKNGQLKPSMVTPGSKRTIWWQCENGHAWPAQVKTRSKGINCPYCSGRNVTTENSLAAKYPAVALQWHLTKNGQLTPYDVTHQSNKVVWWKCEKGHEWSATIYSRTGKNGTGCPFCSGQKASVDNCLSSRNPELAKQWHPTKNGSLTPNDVTSGSNKLVWWKCSNGHEWQDTIKKRKGTVECQRCVTESESLVITNPKLAAQWHPTKNSDLKPNQVTSGSDKKVWWKCENGHEWPARINNRNRGGGCPYCKGVKIVYENSLATRAPQIAKLWHPEKNGNITPSIVGIHSRGMIWWQCDKGHEWQRQIENMIKTSDCPYCKKKFFK